MKTYWLTLTLAAALGLSTALPAVTAQRAESRQESVLKTLPATRANPVASIDDYAAREAQSKDLESFTGGRHDDVVLIGCSCVAVVIIILILL